MFYRKNVNKTLSKNPSCLNGKKASMITMVMEKLLFACLFALLLLPVYVVTVSAATATSNCVITNIGNPGNTALPANCGTSAVGQSVVALGRQYLAGSYVWAAPSRNWAANPPTQTSPRHFDCSGFSGWVWYWATNGKFSMGGQTDYDWHDNSGKYVRYYAKDRAQLQPGDLVYFGYKGCHEYANGECMHHVGIYEGSGACGKNDCFLEWYSSGLPGRSNSLSRESDFFGFLHPVLK